MKNLTVKLLHVTEIVTDDDLKALLKLSYTVLCCIPRVYDESEWFIFHFAVYMFIEEHIEYREEVT